MKLREPRVFVGCLFFSFLVFSPFLRAHWVHDSYYMAIFGYDAAFDNMRMNGRLFSLGLYYLLDVLQPPAVMAMTISVSASLVFLSMAVWVVYDLAGRYAGFTSFREPAAQVALIGSFSLFFNLLVPESFLFFESAIMSLGILLAVLSCRCFMRGDKVGYALSALCLYAGVFCYQADVVYFPPLIILFLGAASGYDYKETIKKASAAALLYASALALNYGYIRLYGLLYHGNAGRMSGDIHFVDNLLNCLKVFHMFVLNQFGFMPKYVFALMIVLLLAVFLVAVIKAKKYRTLVFYATAFIVLVLCAFLPHLAMAEWYVMPRSVVALAGVGGLIMLGISLSVKKAGIKTVLLCVVFLLIISQQQIDMQKNCYANNQLDALDITYLANQISDYEFKTGVKVETVYFAFADPPAYYREALDNYRDLTLRELAVDWMPAALLGASMERDYADLRMNYEDFETLYSQNRLTENAKTFYIDGTPDKPVSYRTVFESTAMYVCVH